MNKNAFDFIRNSLNRIADGIASSDGRYPVWDYKSLLELINTLEEEYKKNDGASARSSLQQTCNNLATDTISRASAIAEITEYGSGRTVYMSVGELKRRIEQLPPAQPEIVRCKDCRWKNKHFCNRAVELFIHDEDFCSWAERREE